MVLFFEHTLGSNLRLSLKYKTAAKFMLEKRQFTAPWEQKHMADSAIALWGVRLQSKVNNESAAGSVSDHFLTKHSRDGVCISAWGM